MISQIHLKTLSKQLIKAAHNSLQRNDPYGAESFFSEAIGIEEILTGQPTLGVSTTLWTDRAICRNALKKYEQALSDCDLALDCNPKCTKTIIVKGQSSDNHYEPL